MPDTDLQLAATTAVSDILSKYSLHRDPDYLRSLLELAFMQGARWYNRKVTNLMTERLQQLEEEVANARS